jgi:hypothetical protein
MLMYYGCDSVGAIRRKWFTRKGMVERVLWLF